jgi:hypothetical protein
LATTGLANYAVAQGNNSNTDGSVRVRWLGETPALNLGTSFGLPWPRGIYSANSTSFTGSDAQGNNVEIQSWATAFWPDNSIKWTGHAIASNEALSDHYTIAPSTSSSNSFATRFRRRAEESMVVNSENEITVNTGKITATFQKSGPVLLSSITTASGKTVGQNGVLVLQSQTSISADDDVAGSQPAKLLFQSNIEEAIVADDSSVRALVTVKGRHQIQSGEDHDPWLQFTLRFYLYKNSEAIIFVHTIVCDGDQEKDFITGIGIRFDIPVSDELYNRHIRLAGANGGFLNEAVQGITGLRRDPGAAVRSGQFNGKETPDI